MNELHSKLKSLEKELKELGSVAVAFSAGVDSTFLLKAAHSVLGENAVAITAKSPCFISREAEEGAEFCKKEGIKLITLDFDALETEGFSENPENRCYICKKALFSKIKSLAENNGIAHIIEGTNFDDLNDFRPGKKALGELGIISPLLDCRLTKNEIRALSQELSLATYDKPSFACLATRIPYGEEITIEKLSAIGKAEEKLYELGFRQYRVRHHGSVARIEINENDFNKLINNKNEIISYFRKLGFIYISLDLEGFKSGNMNIEITAEN